MKKKCAFVLEDNDDIRELFTLLLEEEHLEVKAYPTAAAFKQSMQHEHPDIVIMDVMLPHGNGIEICHELKSNPATADIPIIMTSAHSDYHAIKDQCEAEAFVAKPFNIHDFLTKVNAFVLKSNL